MGASRYMAVEAFTDDQSGREFAPGDFVTGSDYERMGDPEAFRPAEFPEQVAALRDAHGIDDEPYEQAEERVGTQYDEQAELEARTVEELRELAVDRNIEGRSNMNKAQLIQALRAQ